MRILIQLLLLGLLAMSAQKSYALACLKDATKVLSGIGGRWYHVDWGGSPVHSEPISESIAVATALPKGTVLWRSPEYAMNVTCWQDKEFGPEDVYFYLSPGDGSQTQLDPDLEMGVRLSTAAAGTQDFSCSRGMESAHGHCRVKLDRRIFSFQNSGETCWTKDPYSNGGCPTKGQTRTLSFSVFLLKKSPPTPGKDGPMTQIATLPVFQLDGDAGLNAVGGKNFRVNVTNLNNLRYVACESRLDNVNVDFGPVFPRNVVKGEEVKEKSFQVIARKDCDSRYGLNAQLAVVSGTLDSDRATLVPADNPSVGIRIFKDGSSTPLEFNKRFRLVELTEQRVSTQDFLAKLYWRTDTPTLGEFNAAAQIEVYYF